MSGETRGTDWRLALGGAWAWWRDEIAAMLPEGARTGGAAVVAIDLEAESVVLRRFADGGVSDIARIPRAQFTAQSLRAALDPFLSKPWPLRESFALRLPDATALKRNLSLPLAARRNISSLLDIELERQSPLEPSEIYHDYRVLGIDRRAGKVDIVWRIVRRRSVESALETCRQASVPLAVIAFIGDETPPDGGNFPVEPRAALLLRARRWLVGGLAALIALLLIAVVMGEYGRGQAALDAFSARLEQTRIAAHGAMGLEHQIAALRKRADLLNAERARPGMTRLLAEATRLLPQGSWLTEFSLQDGEVRLHGYSNAASSLIALFDASPLFAGAEFRAPLTQAQNGLEQFDLGVKIRRPR